jgi:TetR/AcrR family transcriptional regulator, cholesterol catabolism regulator
MGLGMSTRSRRTSAVKSGGSHRGSLARDQARAGAASTSAVTAVAGADARATDARVSDSAVNVAELALGLFLEHGFDATPMSLIAKEAGLTKAGVYHHFESKEHLLYVVHKRHLEEQLLPLIDAAMMLPDPEERLRRFLYDYALLMTRDPSHRLLITETRRLEPEHAEVIRDVWRRGLYLVRDAVAELQRRGKARPGIEPTYAAFGAIGMCSWIFNWYDYRRKETGPEVARTMVSLFLDGLLRER